MADANRVMFYVFMIVLGVTLWQHVTTRVFDIQYVSPSYILDRISDFIDNITWYIGRVIAILSAYLEWLKLDDIVESFREVIVSMYGVVCALFGFMRGYIDTVVEFEWHPYVIILGTIVGTIILMMVISKILMPDSRNYAKIIPKKKKDCDEDDEE